MNTHVKFEIAKLLKEKGYDKRCNSAYIKKENQELFFTPVYTGITNGIEYLAPTIGEVIDWLYEKYGIWIFADYGKKTNSWYYNIQTLATSNHVERTLWESGFNSPITAIEAAIEYTLNHLL